MPNQFVSIPSDETERGFETLPANTSEEIASAQLRLRELGLSEAAVYVGAEDDPDSHTNGNVIFA